MILKHQISATLTCFDLVRNMGSYNNWLCTYDRWRIIDHRLSQFIVILRKVRLLLYKICYIFRSPRKIVLLEVNKIRGVNL